jgi:hypothetical protein
MWRFENYFKTIDKCLDSKMKHLSQKLFILCKVFRVFMSTGYLHERHNKQDELFMIFQRQHEESVVDVGYEEFFSR